MGKTWTTKGDWPAVREGLTALITGAGSNAREVTAQELAVRGIKVILVGWTIAKLEWVLQTIREAGREAESFPCSVANPD